MIKATSAVTLHINDMIIWEDLVAIVSTESGPINVAGHGYDSARQFYTIHTETPLPAGDQIQLTIGEFF